MVTFSPPWSLDTRGLQAGNGQVCLHYGEADLLPDPRGAPLVFASGLLPEITIGDALVAVDGIDPFPVGRAFARIAVLPRRSRGPYRASQPSVGICGSDRGIGSDFLSMRPDGV